MATYTEKELKEIAAKYGKDISFTELDSNNTYLIKIEFVDTSMEQVQFYCQTLKTVLSENGIKNVIIIPTNKHIVDAKVYKLEKDEDNLNND